MSVNYDRVCRLCLSSRGELLPIFPTTSSDDSEPHVLASKIKDCVSVQINEDDDLPSNACRKCVDNVNNWHIFKSVCEKTQNKLLSLKKDGSQLEEVKIKSEPLSDEAYDDGVVIDGSYPDFEQNGSFANKIQPEGPPILASLGLTPRSDKKCVDPRMDWPRVHAILDLVQDDVVIDSLQFKEETDILNQSEHESDTDADLVSDIEDVYLDCKKGYRCKNKQVIHKDPLAKRLATDPKFSQSLKLGKRKANHTISRPHHAWQLFFTEDILELIVEATNENILQHNKGSETSVNEVKSLLGILYYHGITRPTHPVRADLWHEKFGVPCIRETMEYERFMFLLQSLTFDTLDGDSILQFDNMKRIRKLFEMFALNCRTSIQIGNVAVLDEIITPLFGPCPFRYSCESKELKSGIKVILLVDPSNFYVSNIDVIVDPYFGPEEIAKKMVQHLVGSKETTVVMDSWFTSIQLIEALKKEYQLYSIGAVKPSDEIIPPVFLSQLRNSGTFMTGFVNKDTTLTSYVTNESKSVSVLSNNPKYYKKVYKNHASPVSIYKKNKSAVEVLDVVMNYYTVMQCTNDWSLSLFFTLLNVATINAQVLWSYNSSSNVLQRRSFIRDLAAGLMKKDKSLNKRSLSTQNVVNKKMDLSKGLHRFMESECRKRCNICYKHFKNRSRKTRSICVKCDQPMCREHTASICLMCVDD